MDAQAYRGWKVYFMRRNERFNKSVSLQEVSEEAQRAGEGQEKSWLIKNSAFWRKVEARHAFMVRLLDREHYAMSHPYRMISGSGESYQLGYCDCITVVQNLGEERV